MGKSGSQKFRLTVLCGGPSPERGISLNSCRSVCDHLDCPEIEIQPIYFDYRRRPYAISRAALYSNTPSDFDFKLAHYSKKLSKRELAKILHQSDLVFPVIHGAFGEDGQLMSFLEKMHCPFIGSKSQTCKIAFNKYKSNEFLKANGIFALNSILLRSHIAQQKNFALLKKFFKDQKLHRAVVKPVCGGSSIGVHSVRSPEEAFKSMQNIFSKKLDTQAVCEPFCAGREFTVVVLENRFKAPVALIPSEIETDYSGNQIFDFRKKYLPSRKVKYHCPPRFSEATIEKIQVMSEQLFKLFGFRHFGRFDGWIFPDGNIWFSDFNPISGMEQNSFLFQQAAQIGMSHSDVLMHIIGNSKLKIQNSKFQVKKKRINVLCGGVTAERQVSLMSGTNVWLKLLRSEKYEPHLYLMSGKNTIWSVPYNFALNHTVEEIAYACGQASRNKAWLIKHRNNVFLKLLTDKSAENFPDPKKMTLKQFVKIPGFVFIGLHGGIGENGTMQKILEKAGKSFNGSRQHASQLCMDKFRTGEVVKKLEQHGIYTAPRKIFTLKHFENFCERDWTEFWKYIRKTLQADSVIAKPVDDGCSAGVCRLVTHNDARLYVEFAIKAKQEIPSGQIKGQHGIIEMPTKKMKHVMFEKYIATDKVSVINNELKWRDKSGWIEVTVGVIGKKSFLKAFDPSLTVSSGSVLSLEEKFQGGTGINITPPPAHAVSPSAVKALKRRIEITANALGISGYARIDAFMNVKSGEICVIEANTLPALTPSTVLFQQALNEKPKLFPRQFIEKLIEFGYNK
ncbi:hypothetical protein HZC21_03955 [Candidatus Peregrinibacteria bacterium]|nr:hypothetical protein [Candidatus Peregrinibacteria bacterium]